MSKKKKVLAENRSENKRLIKLPCHKHTQSTNIKKGYRVRCNYCSKRYYDL